MSIEATSCGACGIVFGLPGSYLAARRRDGKDFHCPNGHVLSFRENETDILRRDRDRLKQQLAEREDAFRVARALADKANRKIVKLQKRAKAGVCPCCNRTFSNMAAHMKTKHPDVDPNVIDLKTEKEKRK